VDKRRCNLVLVRRPSSRKRRRNVRVHDFVYSMLLNAFLVHAEFVSSSVSVSMHKKIVLVADGDDSTAPRVQYISRILPRRTRGS
jgi:hypothetical protein